MMVCGSDRELGRVLLPSCYSGMCLFKIWSKQFGSCELQVQVILGVRGGGIWEFFRQPFVDAIYLYHYQ